MSDEQQIRALIEAWATAAHDGDLATVLADHAPDIVMFDVPPPHQGVRGIDSYRDTWPPFFEWQASGAVFEIESLVVTVGTEGAFADRRPLDRDPRAPFLPRHNRPGPDTVPQPGTVRMSPRGILLTG